MNTVKIAFVTAISALIILMACGGTSDSGTITDARDGKRYRTVRIGNRTWMAENLNYAGTGNSWCYEDRKGNCRKYGRLYDWNTAMQACPAGWRLSTNADWRDLVEAAGGDVAATKLKSRVPAWNGTDELGFSALPGGMRDSWGNYFSVGTGGEWWHVSGSRSDGAVTRYMRSRHEKVIGISLCDSSKSRGHSVRCVQE